MHLLQLTLTDFGVYKGKVTFDFQLSEKPIIIIGGKNGAGKTTILEAIKLCLYGNKAFGKKFNRQEYDEYLRNRVHRHRSAVVPLNHMAVTLHFIYSQQNGDNHYEITRYWKYKPDSIHEKLSILLNEKPLSDIPEESWQEYIDDLVPPNVIDLFFFDGERIQELVVENFNKQILAVEVKRLLGLNVIEKMQADLESYLNRQRKDHAISGLRIKLEEAELNHRVIERKYQIKLQELGQIENRIANINGHIEKLERKINQESSGYAFQRESLKTQVSRTEIELEAVKKRIQETAAGLLPFSLIPDLCFDLKDQLINEAVNQQRQISVNVILPKVQGIKNAIQSESFWADLNGHLPFESYTGIIEQLTKLLEGIIDKNEGLPDIQIMHSLSDSDRMQILAWIDDAFREIPNKIKRLGEQLTILEESRQTLSVKLRNVPDDSVLKPIIEELNQQIQQLSDAKSLLDQQLHQKSIIETENEEAQRQLKKAYENLRQGRRLDERLALVEKTQLVLNDFLLQMTTKRIGELEYLIVKRLNSILRKSDLIARIEIDPESFDIVLYGFEDAIISKELLSAGEKQMFAIALLWALRELSGKAFPVIIDTPLGRLDSDHRDNLIKKYFPHVSHQVILFSTDTEIDRDYMEALKENISHSYFLSYDSINGTTNISKGYFWSKGE